MNARYRLPRLPPSRSWQLRRRNHSHSYADTIMMPKTTFPARTSKQAQADFLKTASDDVYAWQKSNLPADSLFILHDGPPYANADVHLGHAVNRIVKDMIVRYQIMKGRRVSYIPGWDCHGLPIELKVLEHVSKGKAGKKLAAKLTPPEIRKLARAHADQTIADHMRSFREWATLGEWENPYRTMDPQYEIRQLEVFRSMLNAGLIYRQVRPVFWSCESHTALAEAELEYAEAHESTSVYVKFPLEAFPDLPQVSALIWTTTPWTIPSNKAIAVNPEMAYCVVSHPVHGNLLIAESRKDELAKELGELDVVARSIPGTSLVSRSYRHPLVNAGPQPILAAHFVTPDSGTGLVHMAPGHGMDDYLLCMKHNIGPYSPVNDYGKFDATVPVGLEELTGKDVLKAGQVRVVDYLVSAGALVAVRPYRHKYPYDWRSKKPVIIRSTAQWFADVGSIKDGAVSSLANVEFVPEAGRQRLTTFTQGRSEWCISRQRCWGVPIPALFNVATGEALLNDTSVRHIINEIKRVGIDAWFVDEDDTSHWVAREFSGAQYVKGKDTMDVWFDSGTSWTLIEEQFGSARQDKPLVDVYMEGSDQHRGWFQSSLLTYAALHKNARAPYGALITHGFTLDEDGKKMSKSVGNVIPPSAITTTGFKSLAPIGVSGLRLWVAQAEYTTDIVVSEEVMRRVADSLSKLRRTFRYILGNIDDFDRPVSYENLRPADQYALCELYELEKSVKDHYERFAFNRAVNKHVAGLSASYFTTSKDRVYTDEASSPSRRAVQTVLVHIFRMYSAILSPIVPLLTQEAWHHAPPAVADGFSPFVAGWPAAPEQWHNVELRDEFLQLATVQDRVKSTMELARREKVIGGSLEAAVVISTTPGSAAFELLKKYEQHLPELFVASQARVGQVGPHSWIFTESPVNVLGSPVEVNVVSPSGHKCPRCWQFNAEAEGELCARCVGVLNP